VIVAAHDDWAVRSYSDQDRAAIQSLLVDVQKRAKSVNAALSPNAFDVPPALLLAEVEAMRAMLGCVSAYAQSALEAAP